MPIKNTKDIINMPANFKAFKKRLPRFVGVLAVNFFKENFTRQGFAHQPFIKWKERKVYLKKEKSQRSTLIKTSALRRSIRIIQTSQNKVQVGTMLPYAQIHNEGGTIVQKPTFKQRIYFSYLAESAYMSGDTSLGNMYSAFSTAKKLTIKIPKRQFIGNSQTLNNNIAEQIEARLKQILLTE